MNWTYGIAGIIAFGCFMVVLLRMLWAIEELDIKLQNLHEKVDDIQKHLHMEPYDDIMNV